MAVAPDRGCSRASECARWCAGRTSRAKRAERPAAPRSVRVCSTSIDFFPAESGGRTCHHPVLPREDGKLVESCDEIPPCSNVAGNKDPKCQHREWVHGFHEWRTWIEVRRYRTQAHEVRVRPEMFLDCRPYPPVYGLHQALQPTVYLYARFQQLDRF